MNTCVVKINPSRPIAFFAESFACFLQAFDGYFTKLLEDGNINFFKPIKI